MFSNVDKAKGLTKFILNKTEEIIDKEYQLKNLVKNFSFEEIQEYNEWKGVQGLEDYQRFLKDKAESVLKSIKD